MDNQFEIKNFINADVKDYAKGVELVAKYRGEQAASFYRGKDPSKYLARVVSLLNAVLPRIERNKPARSLPKAPVHLPDAIYRCKAKLHEYWLHLSLFHEKLISTGDSNSLEAKAARVAIMEERKPFIKAFEQLFALKEEYFALPEESRDVPAELVELLSKLDKPAVIDEVDQQNEFEQLSDVDLLKKRDSIRKQITRRTNQLKYQAYTRQSEENPMPPSPTRTQYENELAMLRPQFKALTDEKKRRNI